MKSSRKSRADGLWAGIKQGASIAAGYFPVAFTFGIIVKKSGFSAWFAAIFSAANLTSAGQFAAISLLAAGTTVAELALTTAVVNLRYLLMSLALSQRLKTGTNWKEKLLISYGVTDELYAVASTRSFPIGFAYFAGLELLPVISWAGGTLLGALSGSLLSPALTGAMGISLYAMFICIVLPPAKKSLSVALCALLSASLSAVLYYIPAVREHVSEGFRLIIVAIFSASVFAFLCPNTDDFPLAEEDDKLSSPILAEESGLSATSGAVTKANAKDTETASATTKNNEKNAGSDKEDER